MRLPQVGETFVGRYVLDKVLGEGGFAVVYDAHDEIGRRVAIKVLKQDDSSPEASSEAAARFQREVRVLSQLNDPCTVRLYDFGVSPEGLRYMVFEHVPGHDLRQLLDRLGTLNDDIVATIMRQVLQSLREAHHLGLLHRDVKPENIRVFTFMDNPWTTKLLDFGIARPLHGSSQPNITRAGELIGTPRYMSPEQLTDKPLGPTSDLYSLGLVMLEARHGRDRLLGDSWGGQIERLIDDYEFIDRRTARGLDAILARLTARDPRQRFRNADEVIAALDSPTPYTGDRTVDRTVDRTLDSTILPRRSPQTRWLLAIPAIALSAAILTGLLLRQKMRDSETAVRHRSVSNVSALMRTQPTAPVTPKVKRVEEPDPPDMAVEQTIEAYGCGAEPEFRGYGTLEIEEGFNNLSEVVYVPKSYDPNKPSPLIVVFHQNAQGPQGFIEQIGFDAVAERLGAILLAPRGARPLSWINFTQVQGVEYLVLSISDRYCIEREKIYLVGHGSGGNAVDLLSCESWVKGLVANSYRSDSPVFRCKRHMPPQIPYLEINTTKGGRMPVEGGNSCPFNVPKISLKEAEKRWIERNNCSGEPKVTFEHENGVCYEWECETPFRSCHTAGGHGWPGSVIPFAEMDPTKCDPPPADFPATQVTEAFLTELIQGSDAQ